VFLKARIQCTPQKRPIKETYKRQKLPTKETSKKAVNTSKERLVQDASCGKIASHAPDSLLTAEHCNKHHCNKMQHNHCQMVAMI